jgi:uncharacterized membrane protein (DUF485 family)
MTHDTEAIARLARRRWRIALSLTAAMFTVYFGFILLIGFAKSLLARLIAPGLSVGILLGVVVIASAWALTLVYVRWANGPYDAEMRRLQGRS